jgi:hypothetical protein
MKTYVYLNSIFVGMSLFLVIGCAEFFSSDFDEDTDYSISEFDDYACSLLSRDLMRIDTLISGEDTTFTTTLFYEPVLLTPSGFSMADSWLNASDSMISATFDTMITDSLLVLFNPEALDTTYVLFDYSSGSDSKVYVFITWELNEENLDAYINVDFISRTGSITRINTNRMDVETIAGCTQEIVVSGVDQTVPTIRARNEYKLDPDLYLARIYVSEPATVGNFRFLIL